MEMVESFPQVTNLRKMEEVWYWSVYIISRELLHSLTNSPLQEHVWKQYAQFHHIGSREVPLSVSSGFSYLTHKLKIKQSNT